MAFWMVGLVALVAMIALAMRLLKDESLGRERIEAQLHDASTPTLQYVVPTGEIGWTWSITPIRTGS